MTESLDDIKFVSLPWNQGVWAVNITSVGLGYSVSDVLMTGIATGPAQAVISSREPYILVPGYLWDDVKAKIALMHPNDATTCLSTGICECSLNDPTWTNSRQSFYV